LAGKVVVTTSYTKAISRAQRRSYQSRWKRDLHGEGEIFIMVAITWRRICYKEESGGNYVQWWVIVKT